MTLHEAIRAVLKENNRPMTAMDIASVINLKKYYNRNDDGPIQSGQIHVRIKNYFSIFENINGHIVLVEDHTWKYLMTNYWFLINSLKGIYILADTAILLLKLFCSANWCQRGLNRIKQGHVNNGIRKFPRGNFQDFFNGHRVKLNTKKCQLHRKVNLYGN